MFARKVAVLVALAGVGLLTFGCGLFESRTCDQGCSNPIQAVGKILSNDIGGLNPDDVQVLGDIATQVGRAQIPAITNEQAAAVVAFIKANGITTIESVQAKIQQAQEDPGSIVIPAEVLAVLQQILTDPSTYEGVEDQLSI